MNQYLMIGLIYVAVIIIIFLWVRFENNNKKISRYEWIILLFSGLGGFALLMTVYYHIENYKLDRFERNHNLTISKINSQKGFFMSYIDAINLNFPESSQIYFEIFYSKKDFPKIIKKNNDPVKQELIETKICLQMLQIIDDFLYLSQYLEDGTIQKCLGTFLLWFRSNTLKVIFNKYLFMFRPVTNVFLKNLILISNDLDSDINNTDESLPILVNKYLPKVKVSFESLKNDNNFKLN